MDALATAATTDDDDNATTANKRRKRPTPSSLMELRNKCWNVMRKIDGVPQKDWCYFRKLANPYEFPKHKGVIINRAFYKLWEILAAYPLPNAPENALLLAEAPGSFLQVVKKKWPDCRCIAVSRPPTTYAQVVATGRSVPVFSEIVTQAYRKDNSVSFVYGNLCDPLFNVGGPVLPEETIDSSKLQRGVSTHSVSPGTIDIARQPPLFDLITADGGFDENERYAEKEVLHIPLIQAEIQLILRHQRRGGTCILKVFETFTRTSIELLWLLCRHYSTFTFFKPKTSRPTNSEKYIVCHGFHHEESLLEPTPVPDHFLDKLLECIHATTRQQMQAILRVLEHQKKRYPKDACVALQKKAFQSWSSEYHFQ